MKEKLSAGDLCISKSGRDKGAILLVIEVKDDRATVVDGKTRKIGKEKKKNLKHLEIFIPQADICLAERIRKGIPTGNERLRKRIGELSKKKQEE